MQKSSMSNTPPAYGVTKKGLRLPNIIDTVLEMPEGKEMTDPGAE